MTEESSRKISLIISFIGWAAFVVSVAVYAFVMRPFYYEEGYEAGRRQQFLTDVNIIDNYLVLPEQNLENQNAFVGKVIEIRENELVFENLSDTYNPLLVSGKQQNAIISGTTRLLKRSYLPDEEYQALVAQAEENGENAALISPFKDEEIQFEDFSLDQRIEVLPEMFGEGANTQFIADYVILLNLDNIQFGS